MPIQLYDTMTRAKTALVPADPSRVTMYVCGPTVYNRAHIGNARPAVVFDLLARLIAHEYGADALLYARNVTDIEDKIIASAAAEGVPIETITSRYEQHYLDDMGALGVQPPTLAPHATAHVGGMVEMIEGLVARGHAYAAEGHVLFEVASFPDYGRLSRRPLDEMIAGARVEVAPYKKNAADFVLWKPSSDDQPGWDSPWGRGRPGWHIECSAMIEAVLGTTIDIHGGGLDLQFPHHENEVAQSVCAHGGAPLAGIWMHNGFLSMGSEKMSKSLGNVVLVSELLEQGWSGGVIRLALLSAHYRQPLGWTKSLLEQSARIYDSWLDARLLGTQVAGEAIVDPTVVASLRDDLNTPAAIAALHRLAKQSRDPSVGEGERVAASRSLSASLSLLGLSPATVLRAKGATIALEAGHGAIRIGPSHETIGDLVQKRLDARARRDFVEADRIRAALAADGIVLEDGPTGTTWRRA